MSGLKGLGRRRRVQVILLAFVALAGATGLVGYAMRDGIQFFRSPSQLLADPPPPSEVFRLGGLVETGSITPGEGLQVHFVITDGAEAVPVHYIGTAQIPDLFDEGQGTIATGSWVDGTFEATEILAKHDENYVPREVIDVLREQGTYIDPNDPDAGH